MEEPALKEKQEITAVSARLDGREADARVRVVCDISDSFSLK